MTPEKMFHDLLGLGLNWEVIDSRFERENSTVVLEIGEKESLWESEHCSEDGGRVFCYDHTEELVWRHLNIFQHRCEIHCRLPRGKCRQCGRVYRLRPPWEGLSMHFTKEFEAYALWLIREMPMARVAELTGESDTRLWRMLFKHVEEAYAQLEFSEVVYVGVDEMNVRKGQRYISVFADLQARRVIFATEGHDHTTWERFLQELGKHNGHPHALSQVSMDMSAGYEKGVKEYCRHAEIVFDKFHVIVQASKAVDQVRRQELRLGGEGVWEGLRQTMWLWRKNPEQLNPQEEACLQKIKEKNFCTAKAYQMRLVLQDIYRSATVEIARRRFLAWGRWVRWVARFYKGTLLLPMVKVAKLIDKHLAGILAYWKQRLTNAYMEGLNSVFSAVKRKARGYRSPEYLITMLYLVAGKLRLPSLSFH